MWCKCLFNLRCRTCGVTENVKRSPLFPLMCLCSKLTGFSAVMMGCQCWLEYDISSGRFLRHSPTTPGCVTENSVRTWRCGSLWTSPTTRWWPTRRGTRCCGRTLWPGTPTTKISDTHRGDRSVELQVMTFIDMPLWFVGSVWISKRVKMYFRCLWLCTWIGWNRRSRSAGRTWNRLKGF